MMKLYYNDKLRVHDNHLQRVIESSTYNIYRVSWIGDKSVNWLVLKGRVGEKSFRTKKDALNEARSMAKRDKPSALVVERKKDSKFSQSGVSDWFVYG